MADTVIDIHKHGTWIDRNKGRIQCIYCKKEVSSLHRLKCHLGGVPGNVTSCEQVPFNVRDMFWKRLMEEKVVHAANKRIGETLMGNLQKRERSEDSSSKSIDKQDFLSNKAQKCIGRFFYENGVDFSAVDSPSFTEMMIVGGVGRDQTQHKIPSSQDLDSWMFQETLKEMQDSVKKIKDSWEITGCSILLDAWVDKGGRNLVAFLADCPAGPVYLKSFDVSHIINDVSALLSLVNGLVEEVGVGNVVQVIACSTYGWLGELGNVFAGHDREVFWSASLSHCFELMLIKIVKTHSFGDVLDKVNKVWEFINNNPLALKNFRDHSNGKDKTVISCELEFVTPYLILESIFNAKKDLKAMFASSVWSTEEGTAIFSLMNDSTFWESVERVKKCTSPLIHGLLLFSTAGSQHVGYIYDTMDGIKENIAKGFNHKKINYKTVWDVIDDVWSKQLHNPIHAAGYFYNPFRFVHYNPFTFVHLQSYKTKRS